ncbi:hypothetical protein FHS27_001199 [Rhodopirellula rubra]|uniref:Uncharacterized protein n=1 Tax=Aporhodopirellula rubra TaxID=980271 RepID=A0A7W5DWD5_9BACT|nr:hypothetical protein [Aporhodopirellula rubra]MBB3205399.1 hypothetical protein [Aporhodopirellula rubra]
MSRLETSRISFARIDIHHGFSRVVSGLSVRLNPLASQAAAKDYPVWHAGPRSDGALNLIKGRTMWHTSDGDRTLVRDEAALVGNAIDSLIDRLLDRLNYESRDSNNGQPLNVETGVTLFDALTPHQQICLLHSVASYLLQPTEDVLPLTAVNESAVAAIYANATREIELEIAASQLRVHEFDDRGSAARSRFDDFKDFCPDAPQDAAFAYPVDPCYWRQLAANAYNGTGEFAFVDDDDVDMVPELDSPDVDEWRYLVEALSDWVLWDRDYETAACFLDIDPRRATATKAVMGIEGDYFTGLVPDPQMTEIPHLVSATREIVRRKPR